MVPKFRANGSNRGSSTKNMHESLSVSTLHLRASALVVSNEGNEGLDTVYD